MLALIAGSSGFTLAPTAVPRQVTRVAAANVVMQTMADLRFFVSGSEARTTLAVVVCDGLAGSQRPTVSHLERRPVSRRCAATLRHGPEPVHRQAGVPRHAVSQHGHSLTPLAGPQLGSCAFSGRTWWLSAARHYEVEVRPPGAQSLPRVIELAASEVADSWAFDHAGLPPSSPSSARKRSCPGSTRLTSTVTHALCQVPRLERRGSTSPGMLRLVHQPWHAPWGERLGCSGNRSAQWCRHLS